MTPVSLADVASAVGGHLHAPYAAPDGAPDEAPQVTVPVVIDSRRALPGSLFVALPGTRTDGPRNAGPLNLSRPRAVWESVQTTTDRPHQACTQRGNNAAVLR